MRVGLVAGEASGDLLGAGLIRAIRERRPDATFEGVAGPQMVAAGCEPLEDSEVLAVMGIVEPLRELPKLRNSISVSSFDCAAAACAPSSTSARRSGRGARGG